MASPIGTRGNGGDSSARAGTTPGRGPQGPVIGSAPVVEEQARTRARRRALVLTLTVTAAAAIGVATWAILDGRRVAGGLGALVAAVLLISAGALLGRRPDPRSRMLVSFADRLFDGAILGAVAWVTRTSDPAVAAGALFALTSGFLAAYVRARGAALGYVVEESPGTRAIRCGLIAAALLGGWGSWAFFAVAGWMLLVTLVRTSQVAKEERG